MINLAYKDITHSLGKFLITAMGVGMLLGIVLIMMGVYRGMIVDAEVLLEDIGADLWIVQEETMGPFAQSSRLPEDLRESLKANEGISKTAALAFQNLQVDTPDGRMVRVYSVGYNPFGEFAVINPQRLIAGRTLRKSHYEIVVTDKLGFGLDDKIALGRNSYTVVGITKGTVSSGGDLLVYLSLSDAQELQFLYSNARIRNDRARGMESREPPLVNAIVATVRPGYAVEKVASSLHRWKHKSVYTASQQKEILTRNLIERASKQIGLFTLILIAVSIIIIALIIYTMTLEKIKEIAIMKLVGIPNRMIIKMIMQETMVLGILAFAFGNLFAHLIDDRFPKRIVLITSDAWMLFGVILAASLLASVFGVLKAIRADPASAIGG